MTTGWEEMGVANLAARVRQLDEIVDTVVGELPEITDAVSRLDAELGRFHAERSETGSTLSRHDEQLRELSATVKRLATQVTWIERHIRTSGAVRSVDLDQVDPDLAALAATGEAGRRAAEELLAPFARATLEDSVTGHRGAVERRRTAEQALIDACGELAGTERTESAHREARGAYLAAKAEVAAAVRQVAALETEAEQGRTRLALDDEERRRTHAAITAGERAEAQLLTRLRTKIAAAVGDGAMLPTWLTGPIGPMPPPGSAQRWMDVAAGLLAYRITYDMDDPDDALGELPRAAVPDRRRWYEDLQRGVRELRR
jgi:chromosome segregation ATPase